MRGNDSSRSPRVTEYSSMFSLGDSLARHCATFARQRAPFFLYFTTPRPPPFLPFLRLALLFHWFPLLFVHRFEIKRRFLARFGSSSFGKGGGGPLRSLPASCAREIDSRRPAASRVPVPRATRYSERSNFSAPRSCASRTRLATYPNVTDDYRARAESSSALAL